MAATTLIACALARVGRVRAPVLAAVSVVVMAPMVFVMGAILLQPKILTLPVVALVAYALYRWRERAQRHDERSR